MKVMTAVALVSLAASVSACQPDADTGLDESEKTVTASDADVERHDCRATLSASVRGMTGTFSSAEHAARSVKELPDGGSLVHLEVREGSAAFGWVRDGELLYVIDAHRGVGGWTVGSYEKCLTAS